jgi:hypothetical protein
MRESACGSDPNCLANRAILTRIEEQLETVQAENPRLQARLASLLASVVDVHPYLPPAVQDTHSFVPRKVARL